MNDVFNKPRPKLDWRFSFCQGLTIVLGISVARQAEKALQPRVGDWGAILLSTIVAGAIAGIMSLMVLCLFKRRSGKATE